MNMSSPWSSGLKNETVSLVLLSSSDFEKLYAIVPDPLIWEQHHESDL